MPSFTIMVLKIDQNIAKGIIHSPWLPRFLVEKLEDFQMRLFCKDDLSIVMHTVRVFLRLS